MLLSLSLSLLISLSLSFSPIPASLFSSLSQAFSSPLGRLTIFTAKSVKGNKRHVISPKQKMLREKNKKYLDLKFFGCPGNRNRKVFEFIFRSLKLTK